MRKLERLLHLVEDKTVREEILKEIQRLGIRPEVPDPRDLSFCCDVLANSLEADHDLLGIETEAAMALALRLDYLAEKIDGKYYCYGSDGRVRQLIPRSEIEGPEPENP